MTAQAEPRNVSFKTQSYELLLREDYILEIKLFNEVYTPGLVAELIQQAKTLTGNKEYLVLTYASRYTRMPLKSMRLLRQPEAVQFALAKAYVVASRSQQLRAWFYQLLFRPGKPVGFFSNKQAAETWLNKLIGRDGLS